MSMVPLQRPHLRKKHLLHTSSTTWNEDAGFTLLEMLVALSIFAIVLAFSAPSFRPSSGVPRLRPLMVEIAGTLKLARNLAITLNQPVSVVVDQQTRTYGIEGTGNAIALPPSVEFRFGQGKDVPRPAIGPRLIFFPDGSSTGGRLTLLNQKQAMSLDVEWLTGAIIAQRTR